MDRRAFNNLLIETPLVDDAFQGLSGLYGGGIRKIIEEGVLKLGLQWSEEDIEELEGEAKQGILEKTQQLKHDFEFGGVSEGDLNVKAGQAIENVQTMLVRFLLGWKDTQLGYMQYLENTGSPVGRRRKEDKLRRKADGGVRDRHLVTQKHLQRIQGLLKKAPKPVGRERDYDDDYYDDDFDRAEEERRWAEEAEEDYRMAYAAAEERFSGRFESLFDFLRIPRR